MYHETIKSAKVHGLAGEGFLVQQLKGCQTKR
ncbi:MAG: hypothetical protein QOH31_4411 [Verrucomicrobiota bacterium]